MNYRMKTKDYALSSFTIENKNLQIVSPRHIQIVSREEVKNSNYIDIQKSPSLLFGAGGANCIYRKGQADLSD